jgi:hypothetical protein
VGEEVIPADQKHIAVASGPHALAQDPCHRETPIVIHTVLRREPTTFSSWFETTGIAVLLSLFAIIVSFLAYRSAIDRDRVARERSIGDEFWLRKIVSPNSIEPFVKLLIELRATLPEPCESGSKQDVQTYWVAFAQKLQQLTPAFQFLDLLGSNLSGPVVDLIEKIEDSISVYCGEMMRWYDEQQAGVAKPAPDKSQLEAEIAAQSLKIFALIRHHQTHLGSNSTKVSS